MATISNSIEMNNGQSKEFRDLSKVIDDVTKKFEELKQASAGAIDIATIRAAKSDLKEVYEKYKSIDVKIGHVTEKQKHFNDKIKEGWRATEKTLENLQEIGKISSQSPQNTKGSSKFKELFQKAQGVVKSKIPTPAINLDDKMAAPKEKAQKSSKQTSGSDTPTPKTWTVFKRSEKAYDNVDKKIRGIKKSQEIFNQEVGVGGNAIQKLSKGLKKNQRVNKIIDSPIESQINNNQDSTTNASGSKIQGLIEKARSFKPQITDVMNYADKMATTKGRLGLINDGSQTTDELQGKVYQSAQNSRTSYFETATTVSELGVHAKGAFQNNDEMIVFAEQMDKHFQLGGSSIQDQRATMDQLTQAMASGSLQGKEFTSVMSNAPMLADSIATYMGVSVDGLSQMSSQGLVTADVIKNALFASAEDTNNEFKKLPMTFLQLGTVIKNNLLQTIEPVMQMISKGAQLINDNWSTIEPIFWGLVVAIGAFNAITEIQTAVTWLSVAANRAQALSMLSNPIMWVALIIGVLIGMIYKWVQSVGGLKIAWLIAMDGIATAWDLLQIGFFTGIYWIWNMWDMLILKIRGAYVKIANFMGDMKVAVLKTLEDMVNGAIDRINSLINTLNKVTGGSIETISHVSFVADAELQNEAEKAAREAGLEAFKNEIEAGRTEREANLAKMKNDAIDEKAKRQAEIKGLQEKAFSKNDSQDPDSTAYGELQNNVEDTAGNTASMANSMETNEEDLRYLRDLAEQEVINRFTTAEIKIEMNNKNNIASEMDIDGMVTQLEEKLYESMVIAAEGVHI